MAAGCLGATVVEGEALPIRPIRTSYERVQFLRAFDRRLLRTDSPRFVHVQYQNTKELPRIEVHDSGGERMGITFLRLLIASNFAYPFTTSVTTSSLRLHAGAVALGHLTLVGAQIDATPSWIGSDRQAVKRRRWVIEPSKPAIPIHCLFGGAEKPNGQNRSVACTARNSLRLKRINL